MYSLRFRLVAAAIVLSTLGLSLTAGCLYAITYRTLHNRFDESLAARIRNLTILGEYTATGLEVEFHERMLYDFEREERPEYYQIWLDDKSTFAKSPLLKDVDLPFVAGTIESPQVVPVTLPDGRSGKIAGVTFLPPNDEDFEEVDGKKDDEDDTRSNEDGGAELASEDQYERTPITIVVARDTLDIDQSLQYILQGMIAVVVAATLTMLPVWALVIQKGLSPLIRVADRIAAINATDLDTRIETTSIPSEVAPVIERLNSLLERLQNAFLRERAFSSDVAHELRTPLAGLRANLEVTLSRDRDTAEYRAALVECLSISLQMQQMIETLLSMAKMESCQVDISTQSVALDAIAAEHLDSATKQVNAKELTIQFDRNPCQLHTDAKKIQLVIRNLLDNAVAHSKGSSTIVIATNVRDDNAELIVTNTAEEIESLDKDQIFERFWQADSSRHSTGSHCGLGLPLCKKIV
jgi:two-component system heavy metal sensor histidine kinase CusS